MPVIRSSPQTQMTLNLVVVAFYFFAAANEFWRGRAERLKARWPLIVLLVLHGLFFLAGPPRPRPAACRSTAPCRSAAGSA